VVQVTKWAEAKKQHRSLPLRQPFDSEQCSDIALIIGEIKL